MPSFHKYFSADRPIGARDADKLGRRRFAESLAHAVGGWTQQDSLVIALYGAWGIGKSSIKNMMLDALRASEPPPAVIVEFNPWQFANRDQLLQAFFDEIAIVLGKTTDADRQRVLKSWRKYAAYLTLGRSVGELLHRPLGILVGFIALLSLLGHVFVPPTLAYLFDAIVVGLGTVMTFSSKVAQIVIEFLQARVDNPQSVEDIKEELARDLRKSKRPLLVILDDLDRLTPDETFEMFQIVKANADLPNVIYLLLCDRVVIKRHLEKVIGESGDDFMAKIVQVGFDVPAIERERLLKVLTTGLDDILNSDPVLEQQFDQVRWGNLFFGGLDAYFSNLRDVNRYLGTLAFHVTLLRSTNAFEVNVVDLIALEVLRLFEPALYKRLSQSKGLLVPHYRADYVKDEEKRATVAILEAAQGATREPATQIVKELFPPAQWAFGGSHYGSDFNERWDRELRACSEECFDRYFLLAIPSGDLSEDVIAGLLAATDDKQRLVSEFLRLKDAGQLEKAIDRLEAHKQTITPSVAFLTALFDVGDLLSDESQGMFELSPLMHLTRVAYWSLKQEKDIAVRDERVLKALADTSGVSAPALFISIEQKSVEKEGKDASILSSDRLTEAKSLVSAKIAARAESGDLIGMKNFLYLLFRWRDWSGDEGPKTFVSNAITTQEGALRLLTQFVSISRTHGMGDRVSRVRHYVDLRNIDPFIDPETLNKVLETASETGRSDQERIALVEFRKSLKRRREGKSDDAFMRDDDE